MTEYKASWFILTEEQADWMWDGEDTEMPEDPTPSISFMERL